MRDLLMVDDEPSLRLLPKEYLMIPFNPEELKTRLFAILCTIKRNS